MKISKKNFIDFQGVIPFEKSKYTYTDGSGWYASTLLKAVEKQKVKPFKLYFSNISIGFLPFQINDLYDFIVHCKRIEKTDTKYPVIMSETGCVLDGWHRIAKAILAGDEYIMAVRLIENPPFDYIGDKKDE